MTFELQTLINEARTALGSAACQAGRHTWGAEGGRPCPHDLTDNCSQAVYVCIVCGTTDYGKPGGPGYADCENHCQYRVERGVAIVGRVRDPFDLGWWMFYIDDQKRYHRMLLRALRRQPKPRLP